MVALLAVMAAILAACGLGLFGLGVGMSVENELSAGLLSTVFGLLTLYGAYLFGRASWRTRSIAKACPPTLADMHAHRVRTRAAMSACVIGGAAAIIAPGPGTEKVVGALLVVLGVVVALAAQVEPKRTRRGSVDGDA